MSRLSISIKDKINRVYPHQLKRFFQKISRDSVSAYSAQAAFFIMLSFFPFAIIIISLTQFLPFSESDVMELVLSIVPVEIKSFLNTILSDIYGRATGAVLSLSIITVIWSASRGILSLTTCFNKVYDIKESRNYFLLRGISAVYTLLMAILIVITLILFVFGNRIYTVILEYFPILDEIAGKVKNTRSLTGIAIFFLFFMLVYKILPNRKTKFRHVIPGALFATAGWIGLSMAFSVYVDYFTNISYMYGSLTSIVVSLLWLYFSMYIVFIGCEINYYWWEGYAMRWHRRKRGKYKLSKKKEKDKNDV